MTQIDYFAHCAKLFGRYRPELSHPPHDLRFGDDAPISLNKLTGQVVIGETIMEWQELGNDLKECIKENGGRDQRAIVEQRIAEIKAYCWDEEPAQESLPKLEELETIPPAGNGEPEAAPITDRPDPAPHICIHCRRDPPDGNERASAYGGAWLHQQCEEPFLRARMAEEGLEWQTPSFAHAAKPDPAPMSDNKAAEHQKRPRSQPNPRLVAALNYAERGWTVFPAPPGTKKSHKSAEHSGGARWGATRDPKQIRKDFRKWPDANIGIPTGADNGIVVFETDTPKGHNVDGEASLRTLEEKHGPLPETLMAESPSGSRHRYFNWPKGVVIKNSTSSIGPGIDVRGEGGMVIAPPSVRDDGIYRWLNDNPIADATQWLIDLAVGNDLGLARKHAGGNDGEAPNPFQVAPEFQDLPITDFDDGVETDRWWNRLSGEHKDVALDRGLECIANNSNLLKLGNDNDKWFQLVTSIARSGAPHRGSIFVKYAGAVPGADSEQELRKKLAYCEKNPGTITVATFIHWARECGADFEPWLEAADAPDEQLKAIPGFDVNGDGDPTPAELFYRKDEIDEAIALGRTILIVKSKEDVDHLWSIGIPATGIIPAPWKDFENADWTVFKDADVVVHESECAACGHLHGIAKRVRILPP